MFRVKVGERLTPGHDVRRVLLDKHPRHKIVRQVGLLINGVLVFLADADLTDHERRDTQRRVRGIVGAAADRGES